MFTSCNNMAVFSKPLTLSYSCYELGHCWTPFCMTASTDIAQSVFKEAFKIYGSLYLIAALLRKKGKEYYLKKFLLETLQSSVFLTVNGSMFIGLFCVWRKVIGFYFFYNTFLCGIPTCAFSLLIEPKERKLLGSFYYVNSSFVPACNAAYIAILFERKNRRGTLAIYVLNLAIETFFRSLTSRGIIRPLPNGEVLLFSLTSAAYLYLFRKKDGLPKSISSAFKYIVGSSELPPEPNFNDVKKTEPNPLKLKPQFLQTLVECLRQTPKHALCQHHHGCLHYVLQGFYRQFALGYAVQTVIKFLSALPKIPSQPSILRHIVFNKDSLGLGAFLGCYSAVFKAVNCFLRWFRNKDDSVHGLVAGLLSGLSMMFYKSSVIMLYAATKLGELLYFKGIKAGFLPYIKWADIFIYAVSTAFVFHTAVLEPHNLRPAYWKFLLRVTGNRFATMNRRLIDVFGVNSSKMYPNYWPDYDMRFTKLNEADFS